MGEERTTRCLVRLPHGQYVDIRDVKLNHELRLTWNSERWKSYAPTGLSTIDYLVDGADGKERWRCVFRTGFKLHEVEPELIAGEPTYQGDPWKTALTTRSWLELTERLYDEFHAIYGDAIERRVKVYPGGFIGIVDDDGNVTIDYKEVTVHG